MCIKYTQYVYILYSEFSEVNALKSEFCKMTKIHIGKKIKEVLDKSHFSVVAFAKQISISRDGANKIFKKERINTDLLQNISDVLEHDFFSYYSAEIHAAQDKKAEYGYATKAELHQVADAILKEIEKLREEIGAKPVTPVKKKRPTKK